MARFLGVAQTRTVLLRACPLFRGIWAPPSGRSLFFSSSSSLAVSVKAFTSRTGGEGMPGWSEDCFAGLSTDRWVCSSEYHNKRVLECLRMFSTQPWQHNAKCSPAIVLCITHCPALWLSLPAAHPCRSISLW